MQTVRMAHTTYHLYYFTKKIMTINNGPHTDDLQLISNQKHTSGHYY